MTPEFSRPIRLDTIGDQPRRIEIEADAAERAALAARFGLIAIDRLAAAFTLHREAGGIVARGNVEGAVSQACVVTSEPVPATLDEPVALRFVNEETADEEEIELSGEALDTIAIMGGAIDLGEAAAETMALALEPFPRAPGAEAALRDAGVLSEEQAGPFGALAELKEKLARGGG
ncbi:uncharacterized protein DUF177 involved in 23S rRNA accumulation [Hephaestia caeni]|uniref:Uncharacterized protein DUF177 involved in 23S rRNA accumulation n=1 Tax=Hephaestia caeni TaxID=645617 RepID=A0A397P4I6_9SPHN|nr:DUF177 domain-containing protein [Hephaestia caeni]RIA44460.1 uncharacterized protein DUF177 involved in 23S rRNA accumulation [Hephaestia caeni]